MTSVQRRAERPHAPNEAPADFAEFYSATVQSVFDRARRVAAGDTHLAKDATQEAYARMLKCWDERRWRSAEDNRRYAVAIVTNLIYDAYRRQGRLTELDDEHDVAADDPALEAVVDEMSTLRAVRDLIEQQPVRRRAVAVLFFIEEWGIAEIASVLGITESTVRTQVERLRTLLKPCVKQMTELNRGGERS